METLYAEKPSDFLSDNPLRIDSNVASGPNFVNVQFPTHFNWVVDAEHHGMAAIDRDVPFLYHYEQDLSVKSFSGGCLDFNGAHYQFIGKDDVFDSAVDDPFQACWDYCGMDAPLPGLVGMTAAVGGDREGRCNCLHEQGMVPDSSLFPGSSSNTARTGTGTVTEGDGNTNWLCYSVEGLFCGAQLGPPTTLAQACDDSMDFLLGSSVSIGMLTSTAKAVQGKSMLPSTCLIDLNQETNQGTDFDPSLSIGPRWHDWYSSLNDNPLLDFVQTWQSDYAVTKDTRDEPGWLGSYLNVSDEDPHYSPRIQGPIYCKDSSGNRLSLCQGSWLDNPTNPFDHTSLYKGSVLVAPGEESSDCIAAKKQLPAKKKLFWTVNGMAPKYKLYYLMFRYPPTGSCRRRDGVNTRSCWQDFYHPRFRHNFNGLESRPEYALRLCRGVWQS